MNARELVREAASRMALPLMTSVVSNPDSQVVQFLGILNKLPEDLMTRRPEWFDALWVRDAGAPKQYVTKDTDTFVLNDALPLAWLAWKWKSAKGLEYAEDFNVYERLVNMLALKSFPGEDLDIAFGTGRQYDVLPIYPQPLSRRRCY